MMATKRKQTAQSDHYPVSAYRDRKARDISEVETHRSPFPENFLDR
jgi:hypothetical protein